MTAAVNKKFWVDTAFQKKFENTLKLDEVNAKDYDAIFFTGGHGVISAVCHGPCALVNGEEDEVQGTKIVPFLLADKLTERGATHHAAANWSNNVVVDGRLVTGQNPASAAAVGDAVIKILG